MIDHVLCCAENELLTKVSRLEQERKVTCSCKWVSFCLHSFVYVVIFTVKTCTFIQEKAECKCFYDLYESENKVLPLLYNEVILLSCRVLCTFCCCIHKKKTFKNIVTCVIECGSVATGRLVVVADIT